MSDCQFGEAGYLSLHKVRWQHNHERTEVKGVWVYREVQLCVLLECLGQVEALLHVVMVGSWSVDVSDATVASFYFTVLLQSLKVGGRETRKTSATEPSVKTFVHLKYPQTSSKLVDPLLAPDWCRLKAAKWFSVSWSLLFNLGEIKIFQAVGNRNENIFVQIAHLLLNKMQQKTIFVLLNKRFTCIASQPHSLYLGSWVNLHMYM